MSVANVRVTQILLKRGNIARSSAYVGPIGEPTYDTDLNTIRIHDGRTAGGVVLAGQANLDVVANAVVTANTEMKHYVDDQIAGSGSLFGNANVAAFISTYTGNISANVVTASSAHIANVLSTTIQSNVVSANVLTTSLAYLGNLAVAGSAITSATGKINLGAPANLAISGGNLGDVLYTDGTGDLNWANLSTLFGLDSVTGNSIQLGTNVLGDLTHAVPLLPTNTVADSIALLNQLLGSFTDATGGNITVPGTMSAGNIYADNAMVDRGNDFQNWDTLVKMGIYLVNRSSWSGVTGAPTDSLNFTGLLEVVNTSNTAIVQNYRPYDGTAIPNIFWTRCQFSNSGWTDWKQMISNQSYMDGGSF